VENGLEIPRYIYITENRKETKQAFEKILQAEEPENVLIVTSASLQEKLTWLSDFLLQITGKHRKIMFEDCDENLLEETLSKMKKGGFDFCIGIGGGKVLDVAKYASFIQDIRFLSFPTLLSHDGIASPVAVIREGKRWSESKKARSPDAVVVDIETVADCPVKYLTSGIGDLTANLFASMDREISEEKKIKTYDGLSAAIARFASFLVFPGFSKIEIDRISGAELKQLAWGLILSGISMSIAENSRPASGAEHKISHSLDYLFSPSCPHGYTVSLGNVVSAFLHKRYRREIIEFNLSLGLPITGDDIGIDNEKYVEALQYSRKIRPNRYTILEEKKLTRKKAIELLDEIEETREEIVKSLKNLRNISLQGKH
jgi:glycerol-1-phosphate dehydrogenase [NAD(P)+]